MSSFDWKSLVRGVAPALATVLGSPAAGLGVKVLADALLGGSTGDPVADEAKIAGVLSGGMTPEIAAKIAEADRMTRVELAKLGIESQRIEADTEKAYIADAAHARDSHKQAAGVLRAAYAINLLSYFLIAGVLYGAFSVLIGGSSAVVESLDPGIAAMVGGIIGAAVQWIMQNSAQANGFLFGTSPQSRENQRQMGRAVELAVKKGQSK